MIVPEMKHEIDTDDYITINNTKLFRIKYPKIDELETGLSSIGGYTCVKSTLENAYVDSTSIVLNSTIKSSIIMASFIDMSELEQTQSSYCIIKGSCLTDVIVNTDILMLDIISEDHIDLESGPEMH